MSAARALLVACVFVSVAAALTCAPSPAAPPVPPPSTIRRPDAHEVLVWVGTQYGAPDPSSLLPAAWIRATGGRARLRLVQAPAQADAIVMVFPGAGFDTSWAVNDRQRTIVVYAGSAPVQQYGVTVIVHELGHLWCCAEGPARDGHWTDDAEPGLMNATNYGVEGRIFSERELRAMGLTK